MLVRAFASFAIIASAIALLVAVPGPALPSPTHAQDGGGEGDPGPIISTVTLQGGTLVFTGGTGGATQVEIVLLTDAPQRYLVTSNEFLVADVGCVALTPNSATCTFTVASPLSILLNMGDGFADPADTATIRSLRTTDSVNAYMGDGDDLVIVDSDGAATGPVSMTDAAGPAFAGAPGGTGAGGIADELRVDDSQGPGGHTYTVTANSITRSGSGAYTHNGVETVRLLGGGGNDVINVNATSVATAHILNTGAGTDSVVLGNTTLDPLDGAISIDGGTDNDSLTVRDTGTATNQTFAVNATTISRAGWAGINYSGVDQVLAQSGSGDDQWNITATGKPLEVQSGAGVNTFTVGDDLDNLGFPIAVNGQGSFDFLLLDDRADASLVDYTITSDSVTRTPAGGGTARSADYLGMEHVILHANHQGSAIWTQSAAVQTSVFANDGDDHITLGNGTIDTITFNVLVNGGAGADSILIDDGALAGTDDYLIETTYFSSTGAFAELEYTATESFTLNAQQGDNVIDLDSTAEGTAYDIHAADGADAMRIGFFGGLNGNLGDVLLRGESGVDSAEVWDHQISPYTYELRAGVMDRVGGAPSAPVHYETAEQATLTTWNFPDFVYVLGTTTDINTAVNTGLGSDFVFVVAAGLAPQGLVELDGGIGDLDHLRFHDNGLGHTDDGNLIATPGKQNVIYNNFEDVPNLASDADSDDDGCPDVKEIGLDRNFGGERSPFSSYDWFDVAGPGPFGEPDKAVDLLDTFAILAAFGKLPGDFGYNSALDREAFDADMPWRPGPATTETLGIDLQDALLNLASFGNSCV